MKQASSSPVTIHMPMARPHFPRRLSAAVLACGLMVFVPSLPAATDGFSATLPASQQAAAGLTLLSTAERTALDQLIDADLAAVRQNEPGAYIGTFVGRRSDAELKVAGLDRLTPAELTKLNELVAAIITVHPKPKQRPRIKDDDVINAAAKPEIHGSISVTVGSGGKGRNFWGSTLWMDYFDPASGLGLSVGLSSFTGKGFYGYNQGYYGPGYLSDFPFGFDSFSRGLSRYDFASGDGLSFRTLSSRDVYGFSRRH